MDPFAESPAAGLIAALLTLQALVVVYAFVRTRGDDGFAGERDGGSGVEPSQRAVGDPEVVVCRHCGAENDAGYTFCRRCVNELLEAPTPGGAATTPARSGPS